MIWAPLESGLAAAGQQAAQLRTVLRVARVPPPPIDRSPSLGTAQELPDLVEDRGHHGSWGRRFVQANPIARKRRAVGVGDNNRKGEPGLGGAQGATVAAVGPFGQRSAVGVECPVKARDGRFVGLNRFRSVRLIRL